MKVILFESFSTDTPLPKFCAFPYSLVIMVYCDYGSSKSICRPKRFQDFCGLIDCEKMTYYSIALANLQRRWNYPASFKCFKSGYWTCCFLV